LLMKDCSILATGKKHYVMGFHACELPVINDIL